MAAELPDVWAEEDFPLGMVDGKHGSWTKLLGWRGSAAHGTHGEEYDDLDLIGVVVPPAEYVLGLRQYGSRGTVELQEDPWDIVLYDYRKALSLLCKGNPNVLALLWMPEDMYVLMDSAGVLLLDYKELFSTKATYPAFRGYAKSQLKKMEGGSYEGYMGAKRKALFDEFGYDIKNASHAIRILRQGCEFLGTGQMIVDRTDHDADELLEIKRGEWSKEKVVREFQYLDRTLERRLEESTLPEAVDLDEVNRLAVRMAWAGDGCR